MRKNHPWSEALLQPPHRLQLSVRLESMQPAAGTDSAVLSDGIVSALALSLESLVCPCGLV